LNRKTLILLGGLVLLVIIIVASVKSRGGGEQVKVYAAAVERRDITQTVKASGQINPRVKVNISSHLIGKIEKMFVQEGDTVTEGQPFLRLEQQAFIAVRDDAKARLAMANTELRQSEVNLKDQEIRFARARKLFDDGISSKEALDSAELQRTSAELRVRSAHEGVTQARAYLEKAEDDLRKTTIWSPLSGRVIALNAKEGEVVVSGTMNNPASVIGTIADLSEILAEVDVDETEVVEVKPGLDADVSVDAIPDISYHGKVVEVGSSGYSKPQQPDVQFFRVKVLLERPDDRLRPGMSARAEIRIATHSQALVVPIQAVVERPPVDPGTQPAEGSKADSKRDEVPVVFTIVDNKVHQQDVRSGISDATHVEIVEGLEEGQQVVTGPYRSLKKLKDGDAVKITTESSADESKSGDKEGD